MKLNVERKLTQSQKMMVFVLSMALFGLSKMITEILPSNEIGPIEFSVSYFAFIPLILLCIVSSAVRSARCFGGEDYFR